MKYVTSRLQWVEQVRVRLGFICLITQDRVAATRELTARSLSHHGPFFKSIYLTIAVTLRIMGMKPHRSCDELIDWSRFDPRLELDTGT
jgi:hypothetical protein